MAHRFYYRDLKRVKQGMAAGYTFKQCHSHWLQDFIRPIFKVQLPKDISKNK